MAAPVRLREDFDGPRLRALAKRRRDAGQLRRLLAVAEIYDGRSRGEAASIFCTEPARTGMYDRAGGREG